MKTQIVTEDTEDRKAQIAADDLRTSTSAICEHLRLGSHLRANQRSSAFKGQVTFEYFILFTIMAMLTLIGLTSFDQNVRTSLQGFVNAAAAKLAQ